MKTIAVLIFSAMILLFGLDITYAGSGGATEPFDKIDKAGQELNSDLTDGFGLSQDSSGSDNSPGRAEDIGYTGTSDTMEDYRGDQSIRMQDVDGGVVGEVIGSSEVPME